MPVKWIRIMLFALMCFAAAGVAEAAREPYAVIHFTSGQTSLDDKDKAELRQLFQTYRLEPRGRVFVVGYTDQQGDKRLNAKLSRERAETVRHEIVHRLGIDKAVVLAMGKGSDNPVSNNKTPKGRALNRRAEIYLTHAQLRTPPRVYGPDDPYYGQIQTLVGQAEALIKNRRLDESLKKLNEARALGGDLDSGWHTVYGMAGYYAAAPLDQTRAHLVAAVNLDPYDRRAREFLSRVEARMKVAGKEVTRQMGRSPETAIAVSAVAQQYEYLKLFSVEPLARRELENQFVTMWQCLDPNGAPATYYFDHGQAHHWAFAQAGGDFSGQRPQRIESVDLSPDAGTTAQGATAPSADQKKTIWDSEIFK